MSVQLDKQCTGVSLMVPRGVSALVFLVMPHLLACSGSSSSLKDDTTPSLPSLRIVGPIDDFIYNRTEDLFDVDKSAFESEYKNVDLEFQGESYSAKLRLRGGIRFCDAFPHFKLKMKNDDKIFGGKKFKIVTHGSYELDPERAIVAPNCGGELASKPLGSDYANEQYLYSLQSGISDFHLETHPLTITYKDNSTSLEVTAFGFLIEDFDVVADRYGGEEVDFGVVNEAVSWSEIDDENIRNALLGEEYYSFLSSRYKDIEVAHPDYGRKEISALLPKPDDVMSSPDLMEKFNAAVDARFPLVKDNLESDQIELLHSIDGRALMEAVLFNILVGNTDWALFGLSDHPAGHRNFKFLENEGNIFPVAYDFDAAETASGHVVSVSSYKDRISELMSNLEKTYGSIAAVPLSQVVDDYREKVRNLLSGTGPLLLKDNIRVSFENFLEATDP